MLKRFSILMLSIVICGVANAMDLREAADTGNAERAQQLIKKGVPTNKPDVAGRIPWHSAVLLSTSIKLLLKILGETSSVLDDHRPFSGFIKHDSSFFSFDCDSAFQERGSRNCGQTYENAALIADVFQSEAGFTNAADKKTIVATFGCGPCVAVGGYDRINHVAFVVHFALAKEVEKCGPMIAENIRSLMSKPLTPATPIAIHIRGGIEGMSEDTVEAIKRWTQSFSDLPMTISSEEVLSGGFEGGKSLSIDSRSGVLADYDPKLNPNHREFTECDALRAVFSAYTPNIRIAYRASTQV